MRRERFHCAFPRVPIWRSHAHAQPHPPQRRGPSARALSTFRNRVEAAAEPGPLFPWKRQHTVHHCTVRSGAVGCRDDGGSRGGAADLSLCNFLTRTGSLSLLPCSGAAAGIVAAAVQLFKSVAICANIH